MPLNAIQAARLQRTINTLLIRVQKAEGYFSGVPISVARIGTAIITNAKIADGAITTAKIANATIENAKINDLNASKITTGTLDADRIAAGSITADKLNVSSLSAITANMGGVNAGDISGINVIGGTVRTASSGSRVELTGSPERMRVYDGSNERVLMGEGSAIFYGDNSIRLYRGGDIFGQWSCTASSFNLVSTPEAAGGLEISCNEDANIIIQASDVINMISPSVRFNGVSKTAIVPVGDEYRALYIAESPEVWFMDFVDREIDPLFFEVTEGEIIPFNCTNGKLLVFTRRKGYSKHRFESKTSVEFELNNQKYAQ